MSFFLFYLPFLLLFFSLSFSRILSIDCFHFYMFLFIRLYVGMCPYFSVSQLILFSIFLYTSCLLSAYYVSLFWTPETPEKKAL
jgi:hypothetical protein